METLKDHIHPPRGASPPLGDYGRWSIEELRRFAAQLRVRDAATKSRRELVDLFAARPTRPIFARKPL
jgi:hypothetical protein